MQTSTALCYSPSSDSVPARAKGLTTRHLRHVVLPGARLDSVAASEGPELRRYIREQFERSHGARVTEFLPRLLSVSCQNHPRAALGVRHAEGSQLYLEHYLSRPVEDMIESRVGHQVLRSEIAEVGNLVSTRRGASQLLFVVTAAAMHQAGIRWVVFTATDEVREMLRKMRYTPLKLGRANPALLADEAASWGRYFDTRPQVLSGDIETAIQLIRKHKVLRVIVDTHQQRIDAIAAQLRRQS